MNHEAEDEVSNREDQQREFQQFYVELGQFEAEVGWAGRSSEEVQLIDPVHDEEDANLNKDCIGSNIAVERNDVNLGQIIGISLRVSELRLLNLLIQFQLEGFDWLIHKIAIFESSHELTDGWTDLQKVQSDVNKSSYSD